jgi:REP element-mobilizing transposase RayT
MVIAYHAIWSAYGFWLPNDPRGSWSTEVWAPHLRRFGPATKTTARHSLAGKPSDPALRREMRDELKYPAVRFTQNQIASISRGFAEAAERFRIELHACAVLWDHVHIIAARHRESIEFLARVLKSAATQRLTHENLHPLSKFADATGRTPTPWADGGWERYLNTDTEIEDTMQYVNSNPTKHNLPPQHWPFTTPFSRRGLAAD